MVKNGNECKNPQNSLVAATFEKANTYVFAAPITRDREVGGSNPLAPTKNIQLKGHSHSVAFYFVPRFVPTRCVTGSLFIVSRF